MPMYDGNMTIHLLAGLPRSGSTLLANILAQNKQISLPQTSSVIELLLMIRQAWERVGLPRDEDLKRRTMTGLFRGYAYSYGCHYFIDRSRAWLSHIEMAEDMLGRKVKVLVPVRDIRDIISSVEQLHRRTGALHQPPHEEGQYHQFQCLEERIKYWLRGDQFVGLAVNRIRDAIDRGYRDRLHFVHYEDLTSKPGATMDGIYRFLEMDAHKHDFQSVKQVIRDDEVELFAGVHAIRPVVEPQQSRAKEVLGRCLSLVPEINWPRG